ncbi:MAG: nucleotidyltransferase [Clostridiales Family XIII bacterium]|jgi:dTDP-glucose pyrophosphorylase|nr:nucleotidyltransferase [Clostridiales Family XIII bacterium]
MEKPVLVVMAAGMGSRYGGLKQAEPVSGQGEIIVDFSLYDALLAGFDRAVFIIKEEMEADMRGLLDAGAGKHIEIEYAFQHMDDLPAGYGVPEGRVKPWGTGHAVMAARSLVRGPMTVINADDYYGPHAFQLLFDYLSSAKNDEKARYAMAGYVLKNTVTEYGHVARGICRIDENGYLAGIDERVKIMQRDAGIAYTEDDKTWTPLAEDSVVSMNFWGFTEGFMDILTAGFPAFLDTALRENPLKGEYFLPSVVDGLIQSGKASVKTLKTDDRWYGVTYKEDRESVVDALQSLKDKGVYPDKLWR